MPPKVGIAIGIMMSAPLPVDVRTGSRAMMATAAVIMAGRTRFLPATSTASRTSATVWGLCSSKTWWM